LEEQLTIPVLGDCLRKFRGNVAVQTPRTGFIAHRLENETSDYVHAVLWVFELGWDCQTSYYWWGDVIRASGGEKVIEEEDVEGYERHGTRRMVWKRVKDFLE
jgi:hypothetical protein